MADSSPTARALQTLELLRLSPGIGAGGIAERLGVTSRAARRYVAILREAGIDVHSERGRHGGYRLGRGARSTPVSFSEDEALSLVMAVLESAPGAGELVAGALRKVIRALPEPIAREAAVLQDVTATAPDRTAARPDPEVTGALVRAVAARHRIGVRYRGASGRQWEGEVDPWAVVVRHGLWYLLGHSHLAQATRSLRVDRIAAVTPTPQSFTPPVDLDPVAALEANLGEGWRYPTRVVFVAPRARIAPWLRPPMGRLHDHPDGCVLIGSTQNPEMYAQEWLAAVPYDYRIEGGDELRGAVAALAARCAAAVA